MNLLSYESSTTTNPLILVGGRPTHVNVLIALNLLIQYRKTRLKNQILLLLCYFIFMAYKPCLLKLIRIFQFIYDWNCSSLEESIQGWALNKDSSSQLQTPHIICIVYTVTLIKDIVMSKGHEHKGDYSTYCSLAQLGSHTS